MDGKYADLIQITTKLLEQGESQKVIEKIAAVADHELPFELQRNYVQALMDKQQYVQAHEEARNYEQEYLQRAPTLWIDILLHNHLFIPARLTLNNLATQEVMKNNMIAQIAEAEQGAEQKQAATLQKKLKNFIHTGDLPEWSQYSAITDADTLPLREYASGAQFVLRDSFVKPIFRVAILRTLVDLHYAELVKFIWIDQEEHLIVPAEADLAQEKAVEQSLMQIIQERYKNDNPIEYQNAIQQIKLHMALLFPYAGQVIKNPTAWVEVMVGTVPDQLDADQQYAKEWQQKIQQSIG
ncbi:hypothetical protein [Limosilactobacillus caecicola]|uniref:hypothetical protein n=1 Tax=Limosilactobacillus caecicola TaxID=2941332 RepID=UPI00204185D5|nr:hypothetical protein [Limosilactobacillus caecicola]